MPLSEAECATLLESRDEFVLASTNVDEDLHFSSLYLESTLSKPDIPDGPAQWYSELVAINTQAVERYYLRSEECRRVSNALSDWVMAYPPVLTAVLAEIERRAGVLDAAFPFGWLAVGQPRLSLKQLIELYRRHHSLHRYLYQVARVPEALDRGTGEFTNRLREATTRLAGDSSDPDLFKVLTTVKEKSVFRQEQEAFSRLIEGLTEHERRSVTEARSEGLAAMALRPSTLESLKLHRDKWGPLFYHGYASREPVGIPTLAWRLRQVSLTAREKSLPEMPTVKDREALIQGLNLPPVLAQALHAYGLLGATKAHRRWIQLRNFQRLDRLLELLARELNCAEWDLRVLLPEEVLAWATGGPRPDDVIEQRYSGAILWFRAGEALRATRLPEGFEFASVPARSARTMIGEGIVRGTIRGRCRIASRSLIPDEPKPEEGSILVVAQLDADLVWTLPFFDGLVVEEHGASAHVAIIAREIGIPTVAGIANATSALKEGDLLEIDGRTGTVSVVERHDDTSA
jgi:phosphohistidine swiveling domain-containing protein